MFLPELFILIYILVLNCYLLSENIRFICKTNNEALFGYNTEEDVGEEPFLRVYRRAHQATQCKVDWKSSQLVNYLVNTSDTRLVSLSFPQKC